MPRQGSVKVRTGCGTCRIRKVKCDEGKPYCNRCTQTGRKCDGYGHLETTTIVRQPRRLFPACTQPSEERALHFFHQRAASGLSEPYDSYFWTNLVLQLSNSEPVVRHAIIAISTLYEDISCNGPEIKKRAPNRFALLHYNNAVKKLMEVRHEPLVLVACLLFICIEVLQDNRADAVIHCRHGITILQRVQPTALWSREHLAPMFQRLASLPILFGGGAAAESLNLPRAIPSTFASFDEANYFIEDAVTRTLELSRRGDDYRCGLLLGQAVDPILLETQKELKKTITALRTPLLKLTERSLTVQQGVSSVEREAQCLLLQLRIEISTIWAGATLDPNETAYDAYLGKFRLMARLAKRLTMTTEQRNQDIGPKFRFEIGYLMLIHGIVIKCRHLATRLEALQLVKSYGAARESFWDKDKMYQVDRRAIEMEHGLKLDDSDHPIGDVTGTDFPPNEKRILQTTFDTESVIQGTVDGTLKTGCPLGFIMRDAEWNLYRQYEFIVVNEDGPDGGPQLLNLDTSQMQPYLQKPVSTEMKCPLV